MKGPREERADGVVAVPVSDVEGGVGCGVGVGKGPDSPVWFGLFCHQMNLSENHAAHTGDIQC